MTGRTAALASLGMVGIVGAALIAAEPSPKPVVDPVVLDAAPAHRAPASDSGIARVLESNRQRKAERRALIPEQCAACERMRASCTAGDDRHGAAQCLRMRGEWCQLCDWDGG